MAIKTPFKQKMLFILESFIPSCCLSHKNRSTTDVIFHKGETLVQNEINMFTLAETLMKIKATLTILVGDNPN
tara:strand:+ start:193 stop:411 length:219 start_codon:yes stop_codon:yes gene_type:complete